MSHPLNPAEAEDHIREIRRKRGVFDDVVDFKENWNLQDLDKALQILSNDLYSKETHFLLELVQNADDNVYLDEIPSLQLRLFQDRLESQCNEVGFNRDQVESLCRIGHSTKSKDMKDAIGEKGIGFKSIFKVASVARIHSGPYYFQFDTRYPLLNHGMVIPTWNHRGSPSSSAANFQGTLLSLTLKPGLDRQSLISDLQSLDPTVLLFLRNLRNLKVEQRTGEGALIFAHESKCDKIDGHEGEHLRICSRASGSSWASTEYLLVKHIVHKLPKEEKRADILTSEAILAFPLAGNQPQIASQNTFAFLPIRKYGLSSCYMAISFLQLVEKTLTLVQDGISLSEKAWSLPLRSRFSELTN